MDQRYYHYYEAKEATINLGEIASCEGNAKILQRLRDGDENLSSIILSRICWFVEPYRFCIKKANEDEVGWLGYFIGKSGYLLKLSIDYLPQGEGGKQQTRALVEGIARNQSIRTLYVDDEEGLSDDDFSVLCAGILINLSHLEVLDLRRSNYLCCSALGTALRLRSGTTVKLKDLRLSGNIGDIGVASLGNGFSRIAPFLKTLDLRCNSIGNDGLMALVRALANCTGLEILDLSENDFSLAAAGLGSLSHWLQRKQMILKELHLNTCGINDDGLQALAEGVANHCEELNLSYNDSITAIGLIHLSHILQSESCRLQRLSLNGMNFGDDGAEALAGGLAGNQSLRCLYFDNVDTNLPMTPIGWSAFSTVLCDTYSINNTYLSNHTIELCWDDDYYDVDEDEDIDESRVLVFSRLNKQHPQYAARCKILMSHPHLDMKPFLRWDLKFLHLAVAWFERAKPCPTLTIQTNSFNRRNSRRRLARRVLEESDEVYQSRVLTAMYEFVRELPMNVLESREALILEAWIDQITMAAEEIKRLREDVEQRDGKIARLEEENKRLGKIIIESAKRSFSGSES
eukprot:scaffold13178_cov84-Skeletonema_dohrnii-CCMP3373.AAC.4